ncbi:hypothetical protein LRP31_27000 [Mesorhizobium mediterraneum]|nr:MULTISPECIES: hypothetical protein [Mesorhizobium]WIW52664.1 hypothetical protein LRP31_27000 [Mesorhizobium mediterraneum]
MANGTKAIERNEEAEILVTDAAPRTVCGSGMHSQDGWAVSNFIIEVR